MIELTSSLQKYLLTIYELTIKSKNVLQIDVAVELGYSKVSVSRAVHILKDKGYIMIQQKYLILTKQGEKEIKRFYTNYQFFYQILLRHEFTKQEAQYYSLKVITAIDDQFINKMNAYHDKYYLSKDLFEK